MDSRQADFYQRLRARLSEWIQTRGAKHKYAEYLLVAPDLFHLLCRLSVDKRVPVAEKAKVAGALAYFVSPVDLLPESVFGPVAYVDDIALAAYVLSSIINRTSPAVVRSHWAGDGDVLQVVQGILDVADDMVGSGLWKTLRDLVSSRPRRTGPRKAGGRGRSRSRQRRTA